MRGVPARGAPPPRRGTLVCVPEATQSKERLSALGRVLITVYIILAIAATFRSIYQIATKFDEAPLAYSLSAVSGVVYIIASLALIKGWHGIAWAALVFELAGVLVVGTLSLIQPEFFAHPSVWSHFGSGYLFIPLLLPVLGMLWLRSTASAEHTVSAEHPEAS